MASTHDKVLDHTRQQLSALFDGELDMDEARFLQRRLGHDQALAGQWSRWQLAGDVLRGQATAAAPAGFAGRIAAAVAAEAKPVAAQASPRRYWVPGAALAASVAALAMFMTRQAPDVAAPSAQGIEIASAAQPRADGASLPAAPATPQPVSPQTPTGVEVAAATAMAVAEVPRRAAERRSARGQQQRAAATRAVRQSPAPTRIAQAAVPAPPTARPANPFEPADAAGAIATRPWPRALLPDTGSAFSVDYGRLQATPHAFQQFAPFERAPQAGATDPKDSNDSEDVN